MLVDRDPGDETQADEWRTFTASRKQADVLERVGRALARSGDQEYVEDGVMLLAMHLAWRIGRPV